MSKSLRNIFIPLLIVIFSLSGCGPVDEKTQLQNLFVDAACNYSKKIEDNINKLSTADSSAMDAIRTENDKLDEEMEKLPQKYGFKGEDELEEAINKYEDDKTFEQNVLKAIKDSCGYELESLDAL